MAKESEYGLRLLKEESASEDLFEDKTHERIAQTICNVVEENAEGITIGLEGSWGSGKSTVVAILKGKLQEKNGTHVFYFDAWAHEGDPLRRVFLESLIDSVPVPGEVLTELKSRIANRKKVTEVITRRSSTGLGFWLAFATLLVPLGVALVSGLLPKVTLLWAGIPAWAFILGLILSVAPLLVGAVNAILLLIRKLSLWDHRNWAFLQGDSEETTTQEVSEEEERSSIEFENYFGDILVEILGKTGETKLLIVVDNLDRVDSDVALKLWSTLQTFLQQRNPTSSETDSYQRIWVLVPYDEEGLSRLWENRDPQVEGPSEDLRSPPPQSCAKSFFDKCFQLRIEVPKLILSGWEQFCRQCVEEALVGWGDSEKTIVVDILRMTRRSVNDIPTPRDIKNYVNQVGLLRMHCSLSVSIEAIAYFCVMKYLQGTKNADIHRGLVSGSLPIDIHKEALGKKLVSELCGILFGVEPQKGQQLLLGQPVADALDKSQPELLQGLRETHGSAFWTVFDLHIAQLKDIVGGIEYASVVRSALYEQNPDQCRNFIARLAVLADKSEAIKFPEPKALIAYESLFNFLEDAHYDFRNLWRQLIGAAKEKITKAETDLSSVCSIIATLASCQKRALPAMVQLDGIPVPRLVAWANASKDGKHEMHRFVGASEAIIGSIAETVKPGAPLVQGLSVLTEYLQETGLNKWGPLTAALQVAISSNTGTPPGSVLTIEVFQILCQIASASPSQAKAIAPIVQGGGFYNMASALESAGATKYAGLLVGMCFPTNLDSLNPPALPQPPAQQSAAKGLKASKEFWKTSNPDNARLAWNELRVENNCEFVWSLARSESNKLVGDIVQLAIEKQSGGFFSGEVPMERFSNALVLLGEANATHKALADAFRSNSSIEADMVQKSDLDPHEYDQELYLIVKQSGNKELVEVLSRRLAETPMEEWARSLEDDTYLTSLAVELKAKNDRFSLENAYCDALVEFLSSWLFREAQPKEWQIKHLDELWAVLGSSFQKHAREELSKGFVQNEMKANITAMSHLLNFFDVKRIVKNSRTSLQDKIEKFVRDGNSGIGALKVVDLLLSHPDAKAFKLREHQPEYLRKPTRELYQSLPGDEDKELIERLASFLEIDLSEPEPSEEADRSEETGPEVESGNEE